MHVHVPKPLHGWKALFNEIFVIVIGVLIALGFEQVVEWVHWQHKVEDGEERLHVELRAFYLAGVTRVVLAPCVLGQFDALQDRVAASEGRLEPAPLQPGATRNSFMRTRGSVVRSIATIMTPAVWRALEVDGTLLHLPPRTQRRLAVIYSMAAQYMQNTAPVPLSVERGIPLDPAARVLLLNNLKEAQSQFQTGANFAVQMSAYIRELGMAPPDTETNSYLDSHLAELQSFCTARGFRLADWRAALAAQPTFAQTGI